MSKYYCTFGFNWASLKKTFTLNENFRKSGLNLPYNTLLISIEYCKPIIGGDLRKLLGGGEIFHHQRLT